MPIGFYLSLFQLLLVLNLSVDGALDYQAYNSCFLGYEDVFSIFFNTIFCKLPIAINLLGFNQIIFSRGFNLLPLLLVSAVILPKGFNLRAISINLLFFITVSPFFLGGFRYGIALVLFSLFIVKDKIVFLALSALSHSSFVFSLVYLFFIRTLLKTLNKLSFDGNIFRLLILLSLSIASSYLLFNFSNLTSLFQFFNLSSYSEYLGLEKTADSQNSSFYSFASLSYLAYAIFFILISLPGLSKFFYVSKYKLNSKLMLPVYDFFGFINIFFISFSCLSVWLALTSASSATTRFISLLKIVVCFKYLSFFKPIFIIIYTLIEILRTSVLFLGPSIYPILSFGR